MCALWRQCSGTIRRRRCPRQQRGVAGRLPTLQTALPAADSEYRMISREWLAVSNGQALRFFFERLRALSDQADSPDERAALQRERARALRLDIVHVSRLLSRRCRHPAVLPLFAFTHRTRNRDPDLLEAGASQCLLLTGFFGRQLRRRHNIDWYATLGAGYYREAAERTRDRQRARMMRVMAGRFEFWRGQHDRLANDLRDTPLLLFREGAR